MKKSSPTYTAMEIKTMCLQLETDYSNTPYNLRSQKCIQEFKVYKVLTGLINEELELYNEEDLIIIMEASMILFTKSLLHGSMKFFMR